MMLLNNGNPSFSFRRAIDQCMYRVFFSLTLFLYCSQDATDQIIIDNQILREHGSERRMINVDFLCSVGIVRHLLFTIKRAACAVF